MAFNKHFSKKSFFKLMLEVLLIRPGSTTFDEEGRIKGDMDIPLSPTGLAQATELAKSLRHLKLDCLYVAPCENAQQSAKLISDHNFCKLKVLDALRNLDHGLWQGKRVSEVKKLQPKVYRQFQDHPADVCPPEGETVLEAVDRVKGCLTKVRKRHSDGRVGILVPQPMAAIVRQVLLGGSLGDLWKCELDFASYETIRLESPRSVPVLAGLF